MLTRLLTRALRPILVPLIHEVIEERDRAQAQRLADAINSMWNGTSGTGYSIRY